MDGLGPPIGSQEGLTAIRTLAGRTREMDVMVLKANTIRAWVGGNTPEVLAGVTWTSSGFPKDVRHNLIMVVEACGIGRDDIDPMVLGHEGGHYLINSPYHYQASWNLM